MNKDGFNLFDLQVFLDHIITGPIILENAVQLLQFRT